MLVCGGDQVVDGGMVGDGCDCLGHLCHDYQIESYVHGDVISNIIFKNNVLLFNQSIT